MRKANVFPMLIGLATLCFVAYSYRTRFLKESSPPGDLAGEAAGETIAVEAPVKKDIFLSENAIDLGHHDKGEEVHFELVVVNESGGHAQLERVEPGLFTNLLRVA